jgi:hypothetical protein
MFGDGSSAQNGHFYLTDANGASVYYAVSSNSESGIGIRTDGVNRDLRGNHTFRVAHDYDKLTGNTGNLGTDIY